MPKGKYDIYFKVKSHFKKDIRTTKSHWDFIVNVKHLEIKGEESAVKEVLKNPDFVSISQEDEDVYLYYRRKQKYYLCVVARHLNGDGFIITVYFTDKIKEGEVVWKR